MLDILRDSNYDSQQYCTLLDLAGEALKVSTGISGNMPTKNYFG